MNDYSPSNDVKDNFATAFLVPSTTAFRDWQSSEDTYLWNIFCQSLERRCPDIPISVFVGYDHDDPIYSKEEERLKFNAAFLKFNIIWCPQQVKKGNVVEIWNNLIRVAKDHKFMWFQVCGDDIRFPNDSAWLRVFQKQLIKQDYIGWSAGWSNNDDIATQFLIHDTHWQIFEFVFPPLLKNWYSDNWLFNIYPDKYRYWRKDYPLINAGGNPRYNPEDDGKLCEALCKRYRRHIPDFVNMISKRK